MQGPLIRIGGPGLERDWDLVPDDRGEVPFFLEKEKDRRRQSQARAVSVTTGTTPTGPMAQPRVAACLNSRTCGSWREQVRRKRGVIPGHEGQKER